MTPPFFSIITPTILRPSLDKTISSINSQTMRSWEHIIIDDTRLSIPRLEQNWRRVWISCDERHNNYGNTCRHNGVTFAVGTYLIYLDDDNHFCHDEALSDLALAIEEAEFPDWGIVPIWRHGRPFFHDPPRTCFVDTANLFVKREIGQWPDGPEYTMDGIFVEQLQSHSEYAYKALPNVRPVINMPYSSEGK